MPYGLQSARVRLVPPDKEKHMENYLLWLNDYEITENLLLNPPLTRENQAAWFERSSEGEVTFAIELLDGTHLGSSGIHKINRPVGTATTGCFIGNKEYWGKGLATEANRLRSYYAFHVLGLRVLYSEYFDGNLASANMQRKVGYLECGRKPEYLWCAGRYVDEINTYLTRERWQELEKTGYESVGG
jgi:RimJ/RimL family protein N-acetyltransferase